MTLKWQDNKLKMMTPRCTLKIGIINAVNRSLLTPYTFTKLALWVLNLVRGMELPEIPLKIL